MYPKKVIFREKTLNENLNNLIILIEYMSLKEKKVLFDLINFSILMNIKLLNVNLTTLIYLPYLQIEIERLI